MQSYGSGIYGSISYGNIDKVFETIDILVDSKSSISTQIQTLIDSYTQVLTTGSIAIDFDTKTNIANNILNDIDSSFSITNDILKLIDTYQRVLLTNATGTPAQSITSATLVFISAINNSPPSIKGGLQAIEVVNKPSPTITGILK